MSEPLLHFNGLDGSAGGYLQPPMSMASFAAKVRGHEVRPRGAGRGVAADRKSVV